MVNPCISLSLSLSLSLPPLPPSFISHITLHKSNYQSEYDCSLVPTRKEGDPGMQNHVRDVTHRTMVEQ